MSETWVRSNARKSLIRPKYNPPNGVDLNFGERILFEHDGQLWDGLCQGWRIDGERAIVKTDLISGMGRVDLPIDKVWRVWDARDEEIERLRNTVEAMRKGLIAISENAENSISLVEDYPSDGAGQLDGISIMAKEVLAATKD